MRLAVKRRAALHDPQEHLLKDVVRVVPAARLRIGEPVDHVPIGAHQLLGCFVRHVSRLLSALNTPQARGSLHFLSKFSLHFALRPVTVKAKEGITMYEEMQEDLGLNEIENERKMRQIIDVIANMDLKKKNPCPQCGEELTFEGGCNICKACGWSKCD